MVKTNMVTSLPRQDDGLHYFSSCFYPKIVSLITLSQSPLGITTLSTINHTAFLSHYFLELFLHSTPEFS
ncbi:MAG: hypothetical protein DRJ11_08420 [Candidatus Aminicenantes bacterium]|nr:MAG: hypothetical protein DRJ11_08420 [Candidatus Aminicenantes bacterium]